VDKAPEAFRTISEVAEELAVPKHVLRWEGKFSTENHEAGRRRHITGPDVALLRHPRLLS
jgi:hypothetical protein